MTASLATVAGRVEMGFRVPRHANKYTGGKVRSADLCYRKRRYFLHIVVSLPTPVVVPSPEVNAVDLGLNHPAVTSTRQFLGDCGWKEQERRLFRIKRKLQAKGTKSAKRHLRQLSGQLFRQRKDHDHTLSKRIVHHATAGSTLVLENLTNIRETSKIGRGKHNKNVSTKRCFHNWSFAQFHSFLSYKAEAHGIAVIKVDPRHTSQTCSKCGYQARNNRRSQALFLCRKCKYCLNADLNAAYNIRERYLSSLADFGTSLVGGSPCQAAYRLNPRNAACNQLSGQRLGTSPAL